MLDREEALARIYAEVASGRALSRIVAEDDGLPSHATFWRWHMDDPEIRDNLARARQNGAERLMGEIVDIADTPLIGRIVTTKDDGKVETRTEDMLGHRKLQIETRIKYAQMIAPRKYGPKLDLTSDGEKVGPDASGAAAAAAALLVLARERRDKEKP